MTMSACNSVEESVRISDPDLEIIRRIGFHLYFKHRVCERKTGMADRVRDLCAGFAPRAVKFTRLQATKFIFLKFATTSNCDLVIFNEKSKSYESPAITDMNDCRFDIDVDYYLRVTSDSNKITIFIITLALDPQKNVVIMIRTVIGKEGSAYAVVKQDPRMILPKDREVYFRDLWSLFDINFFSRVFQRVRQDKSILPSRSGSTSASV